jgi:hypothetical protein
MAHPYVYERQTEYWTSRAIEDYFLDSGFQIVAFPLTQLTEGEIPFDFVFMEQKTSKLFGVQYKALYHNARDHWNLNEQQHVSLQAYRDWAYYGFSELTSPEQFRVALHHTLFVPVSINFNSTVEVGRLTAGYYRWSGFAEGLERCHTGLRVRNKSDLVAAVQRGNRRLIPEVDRLLLDVFVVNLEARRLLHFGDR